MVRLLAFVVTVYSLALAIQGQTLSSLITIHPGTTFGGCGAYTTVLDDYARESLQSTVVAHDNIKDHGGEDTPRGKQIRKALDMFFKVPLDVDKGKSGRATIVSMFTTPLLQAYSIAKYQNRESQQNHHVVSRGNHKHSSGYNISLLRQHVSRSTRPHRASPGPGRQQH